MKNTFAITNKAKAIEGIQNLSGGIWLGKFPREEKVAVFLVADTVGYCEETETWNGVVQVGGDQMFCLNGDEYESMLFEPYQGTITLSNN
jgi:hypothetical protein